MKEPYKQGRAYQFGPELCAGPREGSGEALTGGSSHVQSASSRPRVDWRRHGVTDPAHEWTLTSRKPGDPGNIRFFGSGSVEEGEMP